MILLYDLQVGNITPGIEGGGTLPHQAYVLVLPALLWNMCRILNGEKWQIKKIGEYKIGEYKIGEKI